jgi:signal transduction histidine kinase/Tfp pilus assembly protein PilF
LKSGILFLVFVLIGWASLAQEHTFNQKANGFIQPGVTDYKAIKTFFQPYKKDTAKLALALNIAIAKKAVVIQSFLYNELGTCYRDFANYKKSEEYHTKALLLAKQTKNIYLEIAAYNMLGVVYRRIDSIKPAIDNHQNALNLVNSIKNKDDEILRSQAVSLNSMGNIFLTLNQFEMAKENFVTALEIEKKLNNNLGLAINYQNIGGVYESQNQLDSAMVNYKKSLSFNELINSDLGRMICNNSIGQVLLEQKKPKEAFNYIKPTIEIAEKLGDDFYTASSYINLGWAYLELNENEKAKTYINKGLELSKSKNYISYISSAYLLLSQLAQSENDFAMALKYKDLQVEYKEKLSSEKNLKYLFDLISKYENEKKENDLKLKDKELEISRLTIDKSNSQKRYLFIGLILLSFLGLVLFYQNKSRKNANINLAALNNDLVEANKVKTRFFSILNHDLRAPVSSIIQFLHFQKENPGFLDSDTKASFEDKTLLAAENLLHNMEELLLWSKGQMEGFKPQMQKIEVDTLFADIQSMYDYSTQYQFIFINPDKCSVVSDENFLQTIMRNMTSNAIKAIQNKSGGIITWQASRVDNQTVLSITDNGVGARPEQFKALYDDKAEVGSISGLGLHLIRDLAKVIKCSIRVNSEPDKGTEILLIFNE